CSQARGDGTNNVPSFILNMARCGSFAFARHHSVTRGDASGAEQIYCSDHHGSHVVAISTSGGRKQIEPKRENCVSLLLDVKKPRPGRVEWTRLPDGEGTHEVV